MRSKSRTESQVEELPGLLARNRRVLEIEGVLAMDVGQVDVEQPALLLHVVIERRARNRRVEHELVEIGLVRDGVFDLAGDILRRVMFQAQNSGAQQHDAVLP